MNVSDMKTLISQSIEDNLLLLDGSKLESNPIMNTLLDFFPENMFKLEFMDGQIEVEDLQEKEGIILKGRGIEYPFLGAAIELTFYQNEDQLQFDMQVTYDKEFLLTDAFLPLKGTLLEKVCFSKVKYPTIHVSSEMQNQGKCGMYFNGVVDLVETETGLADFTENTEVEVSGPIYLKENGSRIDNFDLVADKMFDLDLGITKLQAGFRLSTNLIYNSLEESYSIIPYIELFTELPYSSELGDNKKIPLSACVYNFHSDIRFRGDINGGFPILLGEIGYFTNGVNITELLPPKDFYLGEQLQLKDLFLDFDIKSNKLNWISLSVQGAGTWEETFGGNQKKYTATQMVMELGIYDPLDEKRTQFLIQGEFPVCENTTIIVEATEQGQVKKAYIKEGSGASLGEILSTFSGGTPEVPEIMVKDFSLYFKDGQYTIQGDCYEEWPLFIGDTKQDLWDLAFLIETEVDTNYQPQISGFISVGDKEIEMSAVDVDAGKGWIFEGKSLEGDQILLSEAVEELFQPVGLSLAQGLPDFYMKNVNLRFEEQGRGCFLTGECIESWQLPAGECEITADRLIVSINYQNEKLIGTITGNGEFAGNHIQIEYDLTKDLVVNGRVNDFDTCHFIYESCKGEVLELLPMPLGLKPMDFLQGTMLFDLNQEQVEIHGDTEVFTGAYLIVRKGENGFETCFVARTGEEWKFDCVTPFAKELDNLHFKDNLLVISSFQEDSFQFQGMEGTIVPGINFLGELELASARETWFVHNLIQMEEEYLPVHCQITDLGQGIVSGKLRASLNLGASLEILDSSLKVNISESGMVCQIGGNPTLSFSEAVTFNGDLTVVENSIHGNVAVGDSYGKMELLYNSQNPLQRVLNLQFDTFSMGNVLHLCSPSLLTSTDPRWERIVSGKIENVDLYIVPEATQIQEVTFRKGIWGSGTLKTDSAEIPVTMEVEPEGKVSIYGPDWACVIFASSQEKERVRFSGNIGAACVNVFAASVEETISAYIMEGKESEEATVSIKGLYDLDGESAALALIQGGYTPGQVAVGLTEAFEIIGQQVARIFYRIGLSAGETLTAIKEAYGADYMTVSQWLNKVGYTAEQAISGLTLVYGLDSLDGAKCLKHGGYSAGEVALTIKNAYGLTPDAISVVLKGVDYDSIIVTSFLRTAYGVNAKTIGTALRNAGYTGAEATGAIKFVYGFTPKAATVLLKSVGYTAQQLSEGLKYYYRLNALEATIVLRFATYTAGEVLFGLKNVYLESVENAAAILKAAGYNANETAEGFKSSFGAEAVVTTVILKKVGYTVAEVACALKIVYFLSLDDNPKVLRKAGYDAVLTVEGLKAAYGVSENEIARSMRGAGFMSTEVAQGLEDVYDADADTTAKALYYGGYTAEETAQALKDIYDVEYPDAAILLKGASYTSIESTWGLKAAYAIGVEPNALAQKDAGFNSEEVACGIKAAYEITLKEGAVVLKAIGFHGKDTSKGLKAAYDAQADETAGALWSAGYTAQETARGLKFVYEESDLNAASTLKVTGYQSEEVTIGLKIVYEVLGGRAAHCMREAGFDSEQVCFGLKAAYEFTAKPSLEALKEGGYTALQNAVALKAIYKETAENISSLFREIGYSAGQTGYSLRIVFSETVVRASIVLRQVGYTSNQTAAGLKTAYGSGVGVVAELLKNLEYSAQEVACYIKDVYSETATDTAKALKTAAYSCDEITEGLRVAFHQSPDMGAATLNSTGYTIVEIASALMNTYEVAAEIVADALHMAGFDSATVLGAIKEVYKVSVEEAAVVLNKAEIFALEIAGALKEVFAATPKAMAEIFKDSGQTVDEIAYSLKEVYELSELSALSVIRETGYSAAETARVIAIAYKLGPVVITPVLIRGGYTVSQSGNYLKNVGRYSDEVTNTSLLGANYNDSQVKEFMKESFGWYTPIEIPSIDLW